MQNETDPLQILRREHEAGLKCLQRLRDAAEYIRTNGFSYEAFNDVAEATWFVDTDIRRHNEKEEKYLFPLLEQHVNGLPTVFRNEHRELWKAFKNLRECVKDVEELRIYPTTVADLIKYSTSVVLLLSNHMTKENNILFPMAKEVLTKKEYSQLAKEILATTRVDS